MATSDSQSDEPEGPPPRPWLEVLLATRIVPPEPVPLTGTVTQVGSRGKYREKPRFEKGPHGRFEWDISVCAGTFVVEEAVGIAFGRSPTRKDCVRVFEVETLDSGEYRTLLTPRPANRDHASIEAGVDHREDRDGALRWWADPNRVTLKSLEAGPVARGGEPDE